jgi:hypothetical protein
MDRLHLEEQLLLVLETLCFLALCVRLIWTGLYRIYPYFFGYLVLSLAQVIALPLFPLRSHNYVKFWMFSEALTVSAYALMVLETYGVILRGLPGIASVTRRFLQVAIGAAATVSLLLLGIGVRPAQVPDYFVTCERVIVTSLLLLVLFSIAFLAYYPVPLNRNVVYYSAGFAAYLLVKTVILFIENLRYYWWYREVTNALLAACCACLVFWLLTISRRGEQMTLSLAHQWSPEAEKRILTSLRSINEELLRPHRK